MEKLFTCPICGGTVKIKPQTGVAVCDSCGAYSDADPAKLREIREICGEAALLMRQNTAAGCRDAIRKLESIAYAADVEQELADCRARMEALRGRRQHQQTLTKDTGKKDTAIGIVLTVILALFVLAAVAGVAALVVLWSRGKLPPKAVTVILCVLAGFAVLALLGKLKSGN